MLSVANDSSSNVHRFFLSFKVTNPVAATTDTGGQAAKVEWRDDGNSPSLQQFGNATISIYVGNPIQQVKIK